MIWKRFRQWVEDCWLVMPLLLGLIICTISAAGTSKPRWICAIFGFGVGAVTMALLFWFPTEDELKDQHADRNTETTTHQGSHRTAASPSTTTRPVQAGNGPAALTRQGKEWEA